MQMPNDRNNVPEPEEKAHHDVIIETKYGPQRVLADPDMDAKTQAALAKLVELAIEAVNRGDFQRRD